MTAQEFLQRGIGRKLIFLGRAADMISISLSSSKECCYEFAIHIMTDCEICFRGLPFTNAKEVYHYTWPGHTVYDEKVEQLMRKEFVLRSLSYDASGCLHAEFSNELEIKTLPEVTASDDEVELWRVFLVHAAAPHLVATGSGIRLEEDSCSQEELDKFRSVLHEMRERKRK